MPQKIDFNTESLTLMGVEFPDLATLKQTADAISSNMFEGFSPTPERIAIIRDYVLNKISLTEFIQIVKAKKYV